jgi:hypothetical protein
MFFEGESIVYIHARIHMGVGSDTACLLAFRVSNHKGCPWQKLWIKKSLTYWISWLVQWSTVCWAYKINFLLFKIFTYCPFSCPLHTNSTSRHGGCTTTPLSSLPLQLAHTWPKYIIHIKGLKTRTATVTSITFSEHWVKTNCEHSNTILHKGTTQVILNWVMWCPNCAFLSL